MVRREFPWYGRLRNPAGPLLSIVPDLDNAPELLRRAAHFVATFYPKHKWLLVSYKLDSQGRPRSGSHFRGVSLDIAPLWADGRRLYITDVSGRSARLGEHLPPLIALAREPKLPKGVAYVAEGDHFHLQLLKNPDQEGVVLIYPHPRPSIYAGDAVRSDAQVSELMRVLPTGEVRLFNRDLLK